MQTNMFKIPSTTLNVLFIIQYLVLKILEDSRIATCKRYFILKAKTCQHLCILLSCEIQYIINGNPVNARSITEWQNAIHLWKR